MRRTAGSLVFIAPAISSAVAPAKSRVVRDVTGHDVMSQMAPPRLRGVSRLMSCGVMCLCHCLSVQYCTTLSTRNGIFKASLATAVSP